MCTPVGKTSIMQGNQSERGNVLKTRDGKNASMFELFLLYNKESVRIMGVPGRESRCKT